MYNTLRLRSILSLRHLCQQFEEMALDQRYASPHSPSFYNHDSGSPLLSTASAPSLRSPNPVYMQMARMNEPQGGNVKVVVRVRNFLSRGMCAKSGFVERLR